MIVESNIDIILDSDIGEFIPMYTDRRNVYYEFVFYPEILN